VVGNCGSPKWRSFRTRGNDFISFVNLSEFGHLLISYRNLKNSTHVRLALRALRKWEGTYFFLSK
jgi:hypothetical protein